MPVTLEIDDGDPWWLSPDVWAVPNDPTGAPGTPIAGQPTYLWARVHNTGGDDAVNATVRFYWANPATTVNRSTATAVGSANVTIPAGGVQEVLCLTPWVPSYVNDGHECIIAEAFQDFADPLPPGVDFQVPTDRHTAQRNLAVLDVSMREGHFQMNFEVHNPSRKQLEFSVRADVASLGEVRGLASVDPRLAKLVGRRGDVAGLGFHRQREPEPDAKGAEREVLTLRPLERRGLTLVGRLEGAAALINVLQYSGDKLVGGLSAVVHTGEPERSDDQ